MSSGKGKRKMEEKGVPLQGDLDPDNDPMKYALSAPRVQIIPGLWRRIVRRRRSKNDAKPWACPCGYLKKQLPRSLDMNTHDDLGIKDLWKIISILEKDGVETVDGSHKARISGITHVPLDFPVICKEIAEGHPLLAIIRTGKGFDDLQYNQIYKPPKVSRIVDGKSAGLHCITLVGGAMRKGRKMHYKFVNTHGEEFCKLRSLNRDDGIKGG
uniref:Peptidase C1A papain C-terminal domain-containing protein n=2 Tax=Oryza TaxID=4527 RepID=A0A0E0QLP2_ORYRU